MEVKQISTILNDVYSEITGETTLVVAEDLSNIVDIGREILATDVFGDNFDNYVKKIIDKIGKTIFWDRAYNGDDTPVIHDSWEYGSALEKLRTEIGDFEDNPTWDLQNYEPDVFSFEPPSVSAKYWNSKVTFQKKISIAKKQVKEAFESASAMNRFFAMIQNRITMKMKMAKKALSDRVVANIIAEKLKSGNNVINLLSLYNTASGDSLTVDQFFLDREALAFAVKTMKTTKKLLSEPTEVFNEGGYVAHTPSDKLRFFCLTDLAAAAESSLYANTFNEEFVKMPGFHEVAFWQGMGTAGSFEDRSSINVIPSSEGPAPASGEDTRTAVEVSGIVGVMFDEWAGMVCCEDPRVTSIWNPEAEFWNYWHKFDAEYMNDLDENAVVFIVAED